MSEAWRLLSNSLSRGSQEYGAFMKIWFMSLLVLLIIVMIIGWIAGDDMVALMMAMASPEMVSSPDAQQALGGAAASVGIWGIILSIISLFVVSGLTINSIRYYAGTFTPSWAPFQFDWGTIFPFIGWSIVLGLIAGLVMIIPAMLAGWFVGMAYNGGSGFMMFIAYILQFIAGLIAMWIIFRLGNKLVGRALGVMLTFGEVWQKTKGSAGFYFGLALFVIIVSWIFSFFFQLVFGLLFGIFTSETMLAIVSFFFMLASIFLVIYFYAVFYALCVEVYHKFFGSVKKAAE